MNELMWFLILTGLVLVFLELFFVPGHGVPGIVGFILLLVGIYLVGRNYGAIAAAGLFFAAIILIAGSFILFFRSSASKWIVLRSPSSSLSVSEELLLKIGARGFCRTPLYPTGKALFVVDGREKTIDVSTYGEYVEEGKEIEVVKVEGSRVTVKALHA